MNKKIVSALTFLCIPLCFFSCSNNSTENNNSLTGSVSTSSYISTIPEETTIKEEKFLSPDAIINIDGHEVTADEFKYYFAYAKYSIDNGDDSYWENDDNNLKLNDLKSQTFNYLFSLYTIYSLADKENITLDENDFKSISSQLESVKEYYNASNIHLGMNFDDYLKNTCCTEDVYLETLKRSKLENKIISKLFENDFREKYFKDYIRILYINIRPEVQYDDDGNENKTDKPAVFYMTDPLLTYTDEEKAGIAKLNELSLAGNTEGLKSEIPLFMDIISTRLKEGDSLDALIKKYNMGSDTPLNDDGTYQGFYINRSDVSEKIYDTAFALSENEISDIIQTENDGWYIIKRMPFDEYFLKDYLISIYMSNPEYGYSEKYKDICSEVQKNMDTVFSEKYDEIKYDYASINYSLN